MQVRVHALYSDTHLMTYVPLEGKVSSTCCTVRLMKTTYYILDIGIHILGIFCRSRFFSDLRGTHC